jgi:hypothetical protein
MRCVPRQPHISRDFRDFFARRLRTSRGRIARDADARATTARATMARKKFSPSRAFSRASDLRTRADDTRRSPGVGQLPAPRV